MSLLAKLGQVFLFKCKLFLKSQNELICFLKYCNQIIAFFLLKFFNSKQGPYENAFGSADLYSAYYLIVLWYI